MQVEHTVAATFQGIADSRVDHQLESRVILHIEGHRNIHRTACGLLFTPLLLEKQLLAHQIVGRIDLFGSNERNEIGRLHIRLSRKRHINSESPSVVATMSIFTPPLLPAIVAEPEAKIRP